MERLADRYDRSADTIAAVHRGLPRLEVAAQSFGADNGGLPGRLGRRAHAHWTAVIAARTHEAADALERLTDVAQSLRITARSYAETDDAVARRLERGL